MLGLFEPQKLTLEPQNLQIAPSSSKQVSKKIRDPGELVLLSSEGVISRICELGGNSLIGAKTLSLNYFDVNLIPILFLPSGRQAEAVR